MDLPGLLEGCSLGGFPAGLTGCRNGGGPHVCCEYDVAVFDGRDEPDTVVGGPGGTAVIRHCSLSEPRSCALAQIGGARIIADERWELRTMLAGLRGRRAAVYADCARGSLVDALFCVARSRAAAGGPPGMAECWAKCAAFYVADAVLLRGGIRPSPAHFFRDARRAGGRGAGDRLALASECIGAERATPVLLARMAESAAGFSDAAEGNGRSALIRSKASFMASSSLHADCYFYLGRACRDALAGMAEAARRRPEVPHLLRVAMDTEGGGQAAGRQAGLLYEAASEMLSEQGGA